VEGQAFKARGKWCSICVTTVDSFSFFHAWIVGLSSIFDSVPRMLGLHMGDIVGFSGIGMVTNVPVFQCCFTLITSSCLQSPGLGRNLFWSNIMRNEEEDPWHNTKVT